MKIRSKFLLSFLPLVILFGLAGGYALRQNDKITARVRFMYEGSMQEAMMTAELSTALRKAFGGVNEMMAEALRGAYRHGARAGSEDAFQRAKQNIEHWTGAAAGHIQEIREATQTSIHIAHEADDEMLEASERAEITHWHKEITGVFAKYRKAQRLVMDCIEVDALDTAAELLASGVEPLYQQELIPLVEDFSRDAMEEMETEAKAILQKNQAIRTSLKWAAILLPFVGLIISLSLARRMSKPLVRLSRAAACIQRGDAAQRIESSASDEIGHLTTVFFDMVAAEQGQRQDLEAVRRQLEIQNQRLEAEVEARTADLSTVNTGLNREIEERREAEKQLAKSVQEKEMLLKEIHHRVKNNLQIIISLLQLQSDHIEDPGLRHLLVESEVRIRSMAIVHETLYQSDNLAAIDLGDYVDSLSPYLMHTYGIDNVTLKMETEKLMVDLDMAIPCGLILNELITNAIKHAYEPEQGGQLSIGLTRTASGNIRLKIADNGRGLPPGFDWSRSETLGMQLLQGLAQQLGATVDMDSGNGTCIAIEFPPGRIGV